jgi:spermidine synthase
METAVITASPAPPPKASEPAAGARTYVLVGSVAAASLGIELIQTRILSFLYYNHVVYLTVTIALLGFGISGVFVSLFASRNRNPERMISILAGAFVISSFVCLAVVSRLPTYFPRVITTPKLIVSYVLLTIPFLFSGGVLGWVFMIRAKSIDRLYAIDLASSGGTVMAFLLLLWPLGGDWFVWLCSAFAFVGFIVFSHKVLELKWRFCITAMCLVSVLFLNNHLIGHKPEMYKTLGRAYDPNASTAKIEATEWTPITRIDLWSDSARDLVFGTPSKDPTDTKMITQDADAFTVLWGPHHADSTFHTASQGGVTSALALTYVLNKKPDDALVIGVGGGIDILTAKAYGAKRVTGVEINQATVALDNGPYRDFLQWPSWDGVQLLRTEGRNYLRSKRGSYDTIVMSGVDTFSALNSGAYVLSENYLYTVEAMEDYLRALKPNGTAAIYRWFFFKGPRESLRLASIFREAADRMGNPHPEQCIMVISDDLGWSSYRWAATFVKKTPFTQTEIEQVVAAISNNPRMTIIYTPKVFAPEIQERIERTEADRDPPSRFARSVYNRLLTSAPSERAAFIKSYQFRIDPVFDDRPFFFEYYKPGAPAADGNPRGADANLRTIRGPAGYYVLYILLGVCSVMSVGCILVPLWLFQRRGLKTPGALPLLIYFACLGAGYMMFEVGAMQVLNVFIGDPAYSLALVLAGLLVASGIGAALSGRLSRLPAVRVISLGTIVIGTAIVIWLTCTHVLEPRAMQFPLSIRAAITLVGLLPVGILLGLPFPTAVREVQKLNPKFIAWAWGVNGVTSVLASIIAIVVAMRMGFTLVVWIAAGIYLLGTISYRLHSHILSRAGNLQS